MRIRFWILVFTSVIVTSVCRCATAQDVPTENALFWRISGNGLAQPSYLFGTYHLLNSGYLEMIPRVKNAFNLASGVIVETELDSSRMLQMMFLMVMPDKKISDLLDERDYDLVSREVEASTGVSMDMLAQLKPTFITVMLSVAYAQKQNAEELKQYSGHPLDSYFAKTARENKKQVSTFESMEEQMAILFDHDSPEEQARQLVEFVKTRDDMIKAQSDLIRMYFDQDLSGMYLMYKRYSKQFGDAAYLLDDRNVKWMKKLPSLIKPGNQFVAVGALHFVGNKGLIKLLRQEGYTVTPMSLR